MKTDLHRQKIPRLLVVEDNRGVRELLAHTFEQTGYSVVTAADGERALELLVGSPDLVVLDLMLPGMDGFEVCRRIRLESQVPLIMLTALGSEDDVMRGFRLGIDDYVTKPFSLRLLVARVAGLLRRVAERDRRQHTAHVLAGHVLAGSLELDVKTLEVRKDGQPVRLTPLEFRILHILAANQGRAVSYDRLIEHAWGHEHARGQDGAAPAHLKVLVSRIRKKLGLSGTGQAGIKAVTGAGYSLQGYCWRIRLARR